jgi:ABC-type sugar transport system permease subunit
MRVPAGFAAGWNPLLKEVSMPSSSLALSGLAGPMAGKPPQASHRESTLAPYLFITPFFLGFIVFQLLPILFSGFLSLAEWNGMTGIRFAGQQNFITLSKDPRFWSALRVTLIITVVCTTLGTAGSLAMAVLLEKVHDRLASVLRVIFFLPSVTSVVVIAYIWRYLYNADYGYFNVLIQQLGFAPQKWLQDVHLALPAIIVMLIWAGLGWDALIIAAGLRTIPSDLYDAAHVDGASGWSEFWNITLPLLRPTLAFVLVTSVIYLWGIFAQPQLLTGGGPMRQTQTIAVMLYEQGFLFHKFGYASAMAIILSLLMFASSYLNFRFVKTEVEY